MAEEVQGIRAFGSETETESVAQVVNDKLAQLKQDHELTWEWHRVGALKGLVLDADGTTELYDLFEIFGISQTTYTLDMSSSGDNIKLFAQDVTRTIEDALGADTFTGIHCFCGNDFWDNLISSDEVKEAFDRWRDGQFFREQQRAIGGGGGFEYAGIWWENYRGSIGNQKFFDDDKAQIFPTGVKNLFKRYNAPANFMETVNTRGKALYAKQEVMKFDVGVEIHTQSNPLHICTRPSVLIEVTDTTPIES